MALHTSDTMHIFGSLILPFSPKLPYWQPAALRRGTTTTELLRDNIPLVSLAVFAAVLYARTVSSLVRPGPWRLATLLPVVVFFVAVPLAFSSSIIIRFGAGLYLAWIGTFKVVLLALGCGPLDLSLPILRFLFAAALPVELIESGDPDEARYRDKSASLAASFTLRVAGIAAIVHLYRYLNKLHLYVRILLHGIHMMFTMELVFTCITGAAHVLGMEVKPHFIRPYLATSLRDFWGRRWNLPVSAILRASVYNPMRARAGKEAGILATFLVSRLMHEALVYYLTLQLPTGEMTAYFLIHGVCRVAEECCARQWTARAWPPPPRPVATVLVMGFLTGTFFDGVRVVLLDYFQ